MNKALKILKVNLFNIFGINKFLKKSLIKKIGTLIFIIYVVLSVMFSLGFTSLMMAENFVKLNMMPLFLSLNISIASAFVLIMTMRTSKTNLYDSKDKDLLLSLPLTVKEIILAKVLDMYVISLLISSIVTIPTLAVYWMKAPVNLTFVLLYILSILLIPIIPTIIGSFFGYFVAKFSSKSNKKNIIEIVLSFIFFFIFFFIQMNISSALKLVVSNTNTIDNIMKYLSYPTYLLREALFNGNILYFIFYLIINFLFIYLFISIIKKSYVRIVSRSNESTVSKRKKQQKIISSSIIKALLIKEKRKYFSSPIYVINSSFGIVIMFLLSMGTLFYSKEEILILLGVTANMSPSFMILIFLLFVIGMTNITASSISIEGSKFWISKSLPIKEKDIIFSKVMFSLLIMIPISIVSIVITTISFKLLFIDSLLLILFVSVYAIVISKFGMLINLKFPKMDAINDQVVVKQSLSSVITILGPMLIFILILTASQFIKGFDKISFVNISVCISLFLLIINFIFDKLLNNWGTKRLKSII